MSGLNKYGNLTKVVTNTTYTIGTGAKAIDMKNTGAATGYWTGDILGSVPVSLTEDQSYSFPQMDMETYKEVTIDATGTVIELSIFY